MKTLFKTLFLFAFCFALASCEDDPVQPNENNYVNVGTPKMLSIGNVLVIYDGENVSQYSTATNQPVFVKKLLDIFYEKEVALKKLDDIHFAVATESSTAIFEIDGNNVNLIDHSFFSICNNFAAAQNAFARVHHSAFSNSNYCPEANPDVEIFERDAQWNLTQVATIIEAENAGIAFYGDTLFICKNGVSAYALDALLQPQFITNIAGIYAEEITIKNNLLLVQTPEGLSQIRFKNKQFKLLSEI